jgi:hypothetical protein
MATGTTSERLDVATVIKRLVLIRKTMVDGAGIEPVTPAV